MPELENILKSLQPEPTTEKVASDASNLHEELLSAVDAAMETEKTASASPVNDLAKIASDLREAGDDAFNKKAQLAGVAFADAAASRFAEWDNAIANTPAVKTASADSFEKFAAENPELVEEAAELGYSRTMDALEKQASDEYAQGYSETMAALEKQAADEYDQGCTDATDAIYKQASWEFLNGVVCAEQILAANR